MSRGEELLRNQTPEGMPHQVRLIGSAETLLGIFDDLLHIVRQRWEFIVLRIIRSPRFVLADLVESHHAESRRFQMRR